MPSLRLASWIALLALLAACSGQGPALTSTPGLGAARKVRATDGPGGASPVASAPAGARGRAAVAHPGVVGTVQVPSRLVTELGAAVLSNNGGALLSDHGGALAGQPGRAYGLAALGAEGLAGLRVVLLDHDGRRVPGVASVVTDGQGAFTLAAPPADGVYTVAADLWDGKRAGTMKARARVLGRAGQATLTLASTFVLVGTEGRAPDVEAEARAIAALTPRLDDSDPPRLFEPRAILDRLGKLEAEIAELKAALGGLGQRVDGLEARVEALTRGLQSPTPPAVALPAAPAVVVSSLPDGGLEGLVGLAFDASGRLYGTDAVIHGVVRIAPDGTVTRVAGGQEGLVDGVGAAAAFSAPLGVVGDSTGNLYVADWNNHAIRKLTFDAAGEATVTTLAGGTAGFQDDRGAAARFRQPHGLALDASGRLVVSDQFNHAIRRVALDGTVTTVAGTGVAGHRDGPASTAQFSDPIGVAVAPDGTIYVSDRGNARIRMIAPDGTVSTLAGDGVNGDADGYGRFGRLHMAEGLAVLPDGRVVVADAENHKLKLLDPATGALVTLAGTGAGDYMDGPGLSAKFGGPRGVLVGRDGRLYVSDEYGSVRVVSGL